MHEMNMSALKETDRIAKYVAGCALGLFFSLAQVSAVDPAERSVHETGSLGESFDKVVQPFFQEFCVQCHGAEDQEVAGDVNLLQLQSEDLPGRLELLRSLVEVISQGE